MISTRKSSAMPILENLVEENILLIKPIITSNQSAEKLQLWIIGFLGLLYLGLKKEMLRDIQYIGFPLL